MTEKGEQERLCEASPNLKIGVLRRISDFRYCQEGGGRKIQTEGALTLFPKVLYPLQE